MKILMVSMVFMIIISGMVTFQIKTSYFYRTAQMIYAAEKQKNLLDTALSLAVSQLKSAADDTYIFQQNILLDGYAVLIKSEPYLDHGKLILTLTINNNTIEEIYTYQKSKSKERDWIMLKQKL